VKYKGNLFIRLLRPSYFPVTKPVLSHRSFLLFCRLYSATLPMFLNPLSHRLCAPFCGFEHTPPFRTSHSFCWTSLSQPLSRNFPGERWPPSYPLDQRTQFFIFKNYFALAPPHIVLIRFRFLLFIEVSRLFPPTPPSLRFFNFPFFSFSSSRDTPPNGVGFVALNFTVGYPESSLMGSSCFPFDQ